MSWVLTKRRTPVQISYTTNNSIKKHLPKKPYISQNPNQYERSGGYQLKCPDCKKKYIGQTGKILPLTISRTFP
jgi:hypothetical protein